MSPLDVRQLDERDDQADRQIYLNALMGARTIDGDSNNNNENEDDDCDAGERETISFFDQSVFFFSLMSLICNCSTPPLQKKINVADSDSTFSLLREEGRRDVFLSRRWWSPDSDDEESDEDKDEDLDNDDEDDDLLYDEELLYLT